MMKYIIKSIGRITLVIASMFMVSCGSDEKSEPVEDTSTAEPPKERGSVLGTWFLQDNFIIDDGYEVEFTLRFNSDYTGQIEAIYTDCIDADTRGFGYMLDVDAGGNVILKLEWDGPAYNFPSIGSLLLEQVSYIPDITESYMKLGGYTWSREDYTAFEGRWIAGDKDSYMWNDRECDVILELNSYGTGSITARYVDGTSSDMYSFEYEVSEIDGDWVMSVSWITPGGMWFEEGKVEHCTVSKTRMVLSKAIWKRM